MSTIRTPKKSQAKANSLPRSRRRLACLRAPVVFSDRSVEVDADNGIIRNVALMTVGAAKGHGFDLDLVSIEQLVALSQSQPDGVKSRFKHPEIETKAGPDGTPMQMVSDDTGTMIGRIKNIRLDGTQARGDVHLGSYAECVPGLGNVREYLIRHATDDPAGIGMSAMFEYEIEPVVDQFGNVLSRPARILSLDAIDFVSEPAANPRGLLSVPASASAGTPGNPSQATAGEFPQDSRGAYLAAIVKDGPMGLGGLASRFRGRLEAMRAGADWLASNGFVEKLPTGTYRATPSGITRMAAMGVWREAKPPQQQ